MNIILKFLLRLLLVAAGLVFALSLMVLMTVLMALWCVRALWCKLTGRPINPFVMRMNPRAGFDQFCKPKASKPPRSGNDNVTDVEVRDIKN